MPIMYVKENFQFNGVVYRSADMLEDAQLTVTEDQLLQEKEHGKHKKTGRWMSPLLNHCEPDADAEKILAGKKVAPAPVEETTDADADIDALRAEFDAIGKAYDNRWGLPRLKNELVKAKKEAGI